MEPAGHHSPHKRSPLDPVFIIIINDSTTLCWVLAAFSISLSYTKLVGLFGQGISPSQDLYLYTGQHKHDKRTQTSTPRVEFEPTNPVLEGAKTVHALDGAATGFGRSYLSQLYSYVYYIQAFQASP
jgi:hypothetical protein